MAMRYSFLPKSVTPASVTHYSDVTFYVDICIQSLYTVAKMFMAQSMN